MTESTSATQGVTSFPNQDLSATSESSDAETKMKTPAKRHGEDSCPPNYLQTK
ncbi:hypothetical protein L195_g056163 [Trifolium pratense]|uniref:Uncharacterized protein n=1 Tax=Trifolium pratense TaxID=57577 RepID=A0A2K3KQ84_TRIPR|nr:hypothetical protein L195_g056163 [Trifolium pratense]